MTTKHKTARQVEAAPSLRARAERARDAAGRFIRRKPVEETVENPEPIGVLDSMSGGVFHGDGTVTFCDAAGRLLRKPFANWLSYIATRLFSAVRMEMARQLEDPSLDDDAREALDTELRRTLRFDAVGILAFRAEAAFQLAQAGHEGAIPVRRPPGNVSVDLDRALAAHREAAQLAIHDPIQSEDRVDASRTRMRRLGDAVRRAPVRSLADLRHKVLYLWPGALAGQQLSGELAATFEGFRKDVLRLAADDLTPKAGEVTR